MFIELYHTDLVTSYHQIRQARQRLLAKWRFKVLRAYTKRWDLYAQDLARKHVSQQRLKRHLPWLGVGLPILFMSGCGLILTGFWFGLWLILATSSAGLLTLLLWWDSSRKPVPPVNPLAQLSKDKYFSPQKQTLFPDLVPAWQNGLAAKIPAVERVQSQAASTEQWGLIGEFNFIRDFERILPAGTFILHSLQPKKGRDDMDTVVIGPKGFWYFEIKYYNAEFEWCDGEWKIWKLNPKTGAITNEKMNEPPHEQWMRMCEETLRNLRTNGRSLLNRVPQVADIKGGLVFNHPKATFNIGNPHPFTWGTTGWWIKEYTNAPIIKCMTPCVILELTEILLKRHQVLNPACQVYSLNPRTNKLLQSTDQKIQKWIDAS